MTNGRRSGRIAAIVAAGVLLFTSCGREQVSSEEVDEGLVTEEADSLVIVSSDNGHVTLRFRTPKVIGYANAKEPFRLYPKGIYVERYDSTGAIESTLVANEAREYTQRQLWEAVGDVKATTAKGDILETPQLFWDQRTGKVYSNKDSKITRPDMVIHGVGFESDERLEVWEFNRPKGTVAVEVEPNRDTTSLAPTPAAE